jgi:hypothetical protein
MNLTLEEELRLDEEENLREVEFIREQLPVDFKEHFSDADLLYLIDAIVDYYYDSGILEAPGDEVDIDMQQVADAITQRALTEKIGHFDPQEMFFVVQADLNYQLGSEA